MKMNTKGKSDYDKFQGNKPPTPGRYHAFVSDVDESFDRGNFLSVTFSVVTGDNPDQAGRQLRENFFLTDEGEATDAICRLAMILDLIGGDEEKEVDWQDARGKNLIIAVAKRKSKKDDKEYTNLDAYGLATWKIGHPDVADVTVDRAFIEENRGKPKNQNDDWGDGF